MALTRAKFETAECAIRIQTYGDTEWFLQVTKGLAGTQHVETVFFQSYEEAQHYANEKYELGIL